MNLYTFPLTISLFPDHSVNDAVAVSSPNIPETMVLSPFFPGIVFFVENTTLATISTFCSVPFRSPIFFTTFCPVTNPMLSFPCFMRTDLFAFSKGMWKMFTYSSSSLAMTSSPTVFPSAFLSSSM